MLGSNPVLVNKFITLPALMAAAQAVANLNNKIQEAVKRENKVKTLPHP